MFEARRTTAAFALATILSLALAACGGGGGGGSSPSTTPSTTVGSETKTLASCLTPTPGKKFTGTYTSPSGKTQSYSYEILAGTYGGANATLEKKVKLNADGSLSDNYSTAYASYTGATLYALGRIDGDSSTTDEDKFSGYNFDLSKKIGETQTVSGVITSQDGHTTTTTVTLTFEGLETLSLAGKSLDTCRIKLDETSSSSTDRTVLWVAPGHGLWSPVKETQTVISGTDAGQTASFIMTSTN